MKLIALSVALVLMFDSVLGDSLAQECNPIWEKYDNMQVKGLTRETSISTEEECKSTCEKRDNCWNIDFNFGENSCWFGSEHKPADRSPDTTVHHWDLTKDCHPYQLVPTECVLTWSPYPKTQVKGLSIVFDVTNEGDCKRLCETQGDCWNIDFNFHENSCWHGSVHKPTSRSPDDGVNHWDLTKECQSTPTPVTTYEDCTAIQKANPQAKSGTYGITIPNKVNPVQVYCDMDTSNGGWTVLQRRKDGSVNFTRNWNDYKYGFGKLDAEFWLGLDFVSALTHDRPYRVRFELGNWKGGYNYAEYNNFKVAGEDDEYRLTFADCSYFGDAGNALGGEEHGILDYNHNGAKFSTYDNDNDKSLTRSCAKNFHGGWWYNDCHSVNINGEYNNTGSGEGVNWNDWTYSLRFTEMKIRST
jgi:hypothetical protein